MTTTHYIIIIFSLVLVAACSPKAATKVSTTPPEEVKVEKPRPVEPPKTGAFEKDLKPVEPVLIVSLKRDPCYGKCQAFELKLYDDGIVKYNGMSHVEKRGYYSAYIGKTAIVNIQDKAEEIGFFILASQYPAPGTPQLYDIPQSTTYVKTGSLEHMVKNRHDSPPALYKFEQYIEEQLMNVNWKPIPREEF